VKLGIKGRVSSIFAKGAPRMKTASETNIATAQISARIIGRHGDLIPARMASDKGEGNESTKATTRTDNAKVAFLPLRAT
jgi:hypothetical protein